MISYEDIKAMSEEIVTPYEALQEFISSFGASVDPRLWASLVDEELKELYKETPNTAEHLKEYADLLYVFVGLDLTSNENLGLLLPEDERKKTTKLMTRAERALQEYHAYYGEEKTARAFSRVHKSNMSKLGDDGKPIKREDGKVLKGPNYQPPNLSDLV